MKTVLVAIVLGGLLAAAGVHAVSAWSELGGVAVSTAGLIALALGALVTFALGAGLMYLVFYSSRHGHDDAPR